MTRWVPETLYEHFSFSFRASNVLYENQTEHQHLILFENEFFGRVMMLDGIIQLTERDEFIYHDMMAHMAMFALEAPERVLIIGGGDGGVLREVLRHPSVVQAVLCEIDESVLDLSKRFLGFVSRGAFEDPRAHVVIADGTRYVAETDQRFDVIIVDSTDPIGPAKVLFTHEFYADCKRALKPGGVLVVQSGLPFMQGPLLHDISTKMASLFADHAAYILTTPTYIGGPISATWASDDPAKRAVPLSALRARYDASGMSTDYYTPELHAAAFALPAYIRRNTVPPSGLSHA
jgi:spermidine synthase